MKEYKTSKTEYEAYQVSLKNWDGGEELKNNCVVGKLQVGKEKVKEKCNEVSDKKRRNKSCR